MPVILKLNRFGELAEKGRTLEKMLLTENYKRVVSKEKVAGLEVLIEESEGKQK